MTKIAAIILAAGQGTRMKSDLHKVLHPIAGRPMLMHLLDSFTALSPAATVVVAGNKREQLEAALDPLGVTTVVQEPQLGTAHAHFRQNRRWRDLMAMCSSASAIVRY